MVFHQVPRIRQDLNNSLFSDIEEVGFETENIEYWDVQPEIQETPLKVEEQKEGTVTCHTQVNTFVCADRCLPAQSKSSVSNSEKNPQKPTRWNRENDKQLFKIIRDLEKQHSISLKDMASLKNQIDISKMYEYKFSVSYYSLKI